MGIQHHGDGRLPSQMTFTEISYALQDGVATITFNRPEHMNAWTLVMQQELREAITKATADKAVRVIVLTGAGNAFSAGADLNRLRRIAAGEEPPPQPLPKSDVDFDQRYGYLLGVPKPLIAAINGPAAGVGLCLALYCDLRYMAQRAKLTTAYARLGFVAEYGVAWLLPRLVGPMNAADLLLSGRKIGAEEAQAMGLVRALPDNGFLEAVQARAAEMSASCSPRSMAVLKRQLWLGQRQTLAQACQQADEEMALAARCNDFCEGVAALIEKRQPVFGGL